MQHGLGRCHPIPWKQRVSGTQVIHPDATLLWGERVLGSRRGGHPKQGSTGRVNPHHSTHFPFSLPGKKIKYFLQGDDDFAVLIAALPVARGFSRPGRLQKLVFFHQKALSVSLGFNFKLLQ